MHPEGLERGARAETAWREGRKQVIAQRKPPQGGISAREAGRTHNNTPGTSDAHPEPAAQDPAVVTRAPTPAFSLRTCTMGQERKICFLPHPTCFTFHGHFCPSAGKQHLCLSSRGWTGQGFPDPMGKHVLPAKPSSDELPPPPSCCGAWGGAGLTLVMPISQGTHSRLLACRVMETRGVGVGCCGWLNQLHTSLCSLA